VVPSRFTSKYVLAEKSASDGVAIMVDKFSRKMKGCCDGPASGERSCDMMCVRGGWWMDGVRGKGYKYHIFFVTSSK
jgi:hypothetical protein